MIAYTSGTTGRPKGAVHVHGGFLVKMASEAFYQADLHPDETLYWVTDMGWIMGPWEMVGAGCIGRHAGDVRGRAGLAGAGPRVGVGRAARRERAGRVADADQGVEDRGRRASRASTTSRACGSSARPASRGIRSRTAGCRTWSGVAGCRSSTSPAAPRSERASSLPIRSRRSRSARSAARRTAWTSTCSTRRELRPRARSGSSSASGRGPGMTRGIWNDPERYMETYWSMYPDVWRHGDWALIDDEGDWYPAGPLRRHDQRGGQAARPGRGGVRARLAPAASPSPPSSACPHETKGEAIWCFCVADGRRRRRSRRGAARAGRDASWDGPSSRRASCSSRRCRRRGRPRSCAAPCARSRSGRTRATCRRPRTRRRSTQIRAALG